MPLIDLSHYEKKKPVKKARSSIDFSTLLQKDFTFGAAQLPDKKKEFLYLELSSLLKAGIDFKSAFELVTAEERNERDKGLFDNIQTSVIKGLAFSAALEATGRFSPYEVVSLQIGEETGKLIEVLQDLAKFYKNRIKQRRTIVSSLTYPAIVLSTSLGAVFFMLKFVVPTFGDVFKRFGGELPWITQKIINISDALQNNLSAFIIIAVAVTVLLFRIRKTAAFRRISSGLILKLPVIGTIVKKIYLARLCNSLRLLINARLPLLRAIALSRQMAGYYPLEAALLVVEQDIMKGRSLHQSLKNFTVFPAKMIQLIKVGEETNQLDYFFAWVSEQYVAEVEHQTSTLSNIMQPFIIIFLGLIVGVILVSMYLPLFQMSNNIQ